MRILITALVVSLAGCASIGQRAAASAAMSRATVDSASPRAATTLRQPATAATNPERAAQATAAARRSAVPAHSQRFATEFLTSIPWRPEVSAIRQPEVIASLLRGGTSTQERWTTLVRNVLSNDKLADAVIWIGSAPLRLTVSRGGFFVALRVATP